MFNHVRTLLLNQDGANSPTKEFFAEELVPPEYVAVDTTGYLDTVLNILFGANSDRAMRNYRLRQFMSILHATELEKHVMEFDPRITYKATDRDLITYQYGLFATQTQGTSNNLLFTGEQAVIDALGTMDFMFVIDVSPASTIVRRHIPTAREKSYDPPTLQSPVPLSGTGFGFSLTNNVSKSQFVVEGRLQPQWCLGSIVAMLRNIGEPVLIQIFGLGDDEPYVTLRNLWQRHPETAYQLGAILLAVAYRMERLRNG